MKTGLKTITIREIFSKLHEIKEKEHGNTQMLYMEMHQETLRDIILDPDVATYIGYSAAVASATQNVENLFGVRIFTHTDSTKRFMITFTYRTDILMGGEDLV